MKKNHYVLLCLALAGMVTSCQKEQTATSLPHTTHPSVYQPDGRFKKEITLSDESGRNTLFLAVYSNKQEALDNYLKNTELKLVIAKEEEIAQLKKQGLDQQRNSQSEEHNAEEETNIDGVTVETINSNIEENVTGYYIDAKVKSSSRTFEDGGSKVEYIDESDWIGVVHTGGIYDIGVLFRYKPNAILSPWRDYGKTLLSGLSKIPTEYSAYLYAPKSNRISAVVALDKRQATITYKVYYDLNQYRGRDCRYGGTYDGESMGTAPAGTTAFIWSSNPSNPHLYYTPLNGNQCPLPQSGFDGANCHITNPLLQGLSVDWDAPFIWNNRWYLHTNKL
jgi:hypothetical protein